MPTTMKNLACIVSSTPISRLALLTVVGLPLNKLIGMHGEGMANQRTSDSLDQELKGVAMASRNLVNEVMSEHIIYGGLLATRGEVYEDVIALGHGPKAAEAFACGINVKAVNPADHQNRMTLKQLRERESK